MAVTPVQKTLFAFQRFGLGAKLAGVSRIVSDPIGMLRNDVKASMKLSAVSFTPCNLRDRILVI